MSAAENAPQPTEFTIEQVVHPELLAVPLEFTSPITGIEHNGTLADAIAGEGCPMHADVMYTASLAETPEEARTEVLAMFAGMNRQRSMVNVAQKAIEISEKKN